MGTLFQVRDTMLQPARDRLTIYSQTPLIALQAAMPMKDMATSTATFFFLRYIYIPYFAFRFIDADNQT